MKVPFTDVKKRIVPSFSKHRLYRGEMDMALENLEITKKQVLILKPIIEKILSRKYGREIKFSDITIGKITVDSGDEV